jgi:hypothetical protein
LISEVERGHSHILCLPQGLLELQVNSFTGTIPDEFYSSTTIKRLRVNNNKLTGSISPLIGGMLSLEDYAVGNNNLTGTLPTQLFSLPAIVTFNVTGNSLAGTLSEDFALLKNTTRNLVLDTNQFSGPIPAAFDSMTILSK